MGYENPYLKNIIAFHVTQTYLNSSPLIFKSKLMVLFDIMVCNHSLGYLMPESVKQNFYLIISYLSTLYGFKYSYQISRIFKQFYMTTECSLLPCTEHATGSYCLATLMSSDRTKQICLWMTLYIYIYIYIYTTHTHISI